jgi:three-Cys-motif partner protein
MGVSIENQRWLERIDALKSTPAAIKFLSCEPLLGPLNIDLHGIDWVIVGGESGPGARSMKIEWVTSIRDQCAETRVPFFFKQWGEYDSEGVRRGKKRAGRILDGQTWNEMPRVKHMANKDKSEQKFGGSWTKEKLKILKKYLDSYTTALKNQRLRISYIDAFAGTGWVEISQNSDNDQRGFLEGSTKIAYDVQDKSFDKLVFIEKNAEKAETLKAQFEDQDRIDVRVSDANQELQRICATGSEEFWEKNRAVVFLDPFALEVDWATIEAISEIPVFDVWILFPVGAIRRMLPRRKLPREVDPKWELKLNAVFGDERWKSMYQTTPSLFGDQMESVPGTDPIAELYKEKLRTVFPGVASKSATLRNSTESPLFEFIFAVSNPSEKAQSAALRIANHILQHI